MRPARRATGPGLRVAAALVAVFASLLRAAPLPAAEVPEYELKAEFLERFTRFVDWPESGFSGAQAPFVIGLWAENPFGTYLERIAATQSIKGRSVRIRTVAELREIEGCNLLFVPGGRRADLRRILREVSARPILLVGDGTGFAEQGVHINFVSEGDRVRFEVNEAAAHEARLRISAKLLRLAKPGRQED